MTFVQILWFLWDSWLVLMNFRCCNILGCGPGYLGLKAFHWVRIQFSRRKKDTCYFGLYKDIHFTGNNLYELIRYMRRFCHVQNRNDFEKFSLKCDGKQPNQHYGHID